MTSSDDLDPGAYTSSPPLDVPSQIALNNQLLAAAPAELPPQVETCKRRLLTITRALELGFQVSQDEGPSVPKRSIDQCTDNTWVSCKVRLDPYTWLDEQRFADAGKAKALSRRLFPTGLSFTQYEYGAQWAEANWRMKVIAEEGLEPELRRLCGDVFVDELFAWHKEYGKMVGTVAATKRRGAADKTPPRPNLAELRREAAQAVVAWQVQLVALHLAGHPGARAGLRPTDDYRNKIAAAAARATPEPTAPSDPVPAPAAQSEVVPK